MQETERFQAHVRQLQAVAAESQRHSRDLVATHCNATTLAASVADAATSSPAALAVRCGHDLREASRQCEQLALTRLAALELCEKDLAAVHVASASASGLEGAVSRAESLALGELHRVEQRVGNFLSHPLSHRHGHGHHGLDEAAAMAKAQEYAPPQPPPPPPPLAVAGKVAGGGGGSGSGGSAGGGSATGAAVVAKYSLEAAVAASGGRALAAAEWTRRDRAADIAALPGSGGAAGPREWLLVGIPTVARVHNEDHLLRVISAILNQVRPKTRPWDRPPVCVCLCV